MGDLFLFLQLLFGFGHFFPCVLNICSGGCFSSSSLACSLLLFFLGLHHFLSFHFCFFKAFLFLFSLLGLLFGLFLAKSFLLFLLLLIQFLFLFGPDLLALLQFFLLLFPLFAPFIDIVPQLFVEFTLLFLGLEASSPTRIRCFRSHD